MHAPPRILIVDDNETNRDILRSRLGPQGYDYWKPPTGKKRWPRHGNTIPI
jgi:adenylate cyclase